MLGVIKLLRRLIFSRLVFFNPFPLWHGDRFIAAALPRVKPNQKPQQSD